MLYNIIIVALVVVAAVAVAWLMAIMEDYIEHLTTKPKDDYYDKEDWWGL